MAVLCDFCAGITHSLQVLETWAGTVYLQSMIMVRVSLSFASWNGGWPHTNMNRITPRLQMSEAKGIKQKHNRIHDQTVFNHYRNLYTVWRRISNTVLCEIWALIVIFQDEQTILNILMWIIIYCFIYHLPYKKVQNVKMETQGFAAEGNNSGEHLSSLSKFWDLYHYIVSFYNKQRPIWPHPAASTRKALACLNKIENYKNIWGFV